MTATSPFGINATLESLKHEQDRPGGSKWRKDARILSQYLRRDYRDTQDQLQDQRPKTHHLHSLRVVPLVHRMSRELATLYLRPVTREFPGAEDYTVQRISSIYDGANVDRTLRTAHEQLVAINNATLWVFPVPAVGGVRLLAPPVHLQRFASSDPTSTSEKDLTDAWLTMPVGTDSQGRPQYATAHITPEIAVWETHPDESQVGAGLWSPDGFNPIGEIPVIMMRGADTEPGDWFAPLPLDLLAAQRDLNLSLTYLGYVATLQGYSQPWIKGMGQEDLKDLEIGPETAVGLGAEGEFGFASPSPDLAGFLAQVKEFVSETVAFNGLNPSAIMRSSALTGAAKMADLLDRQTERLRHLTEFGRAEQRLYSLIRKWVNYQRGIDLLPEGVKVKVQYREPIPTVDPQAAAQALQIRVSLGQTSEVRERAREDGISLQEAEERVLEDVRYTHRVAKLRAQLAAEIEPSEAGTEAA